MVGVGLGVGQTFYGFTIDGVLNKDVMFALKMEFLNGCRVGQLKIV